MEIDRLPSDFIQGFKAQVNTPIFFKVIENREKLKKIWGLKVRGRVIILFFQSFCSLDMFIVFLFFFHCLVASKTS